ncbi:MAG: purine-nucleoside phosphorylase [Lachnospiraceae bacterium]|nr:purine-nucleoside phosphorylase [Lachnospiraceae bacterium]
MYQINMNQDSVQRIISFAPSIGLILGSGLGDYGEKLEDPEFISYSEIEGFPVSKVEGHKNRFILGKLGEKRVIAMQGRFHFYEGFTQDMLAAPIHIMQRAGVKTVILTNAAGGLNVGFRPGELMLISDHINLSGSNPLIGDNDAGFGPRFPDMTDVYTASLREKIKERAAEAELELREGVYVMASGPSYETPAEVRAMQILGGDAVGMSTVPEAILARHCGLKVIGVSCVTNPAAGISGQPLSHEEVMAAAESAKKRFEKLVDLMITEICE